MVRVQRLLGANAEGSDSVAYVFCALTVAASAIHIYLLKYWPGWRYSPRPSIFAYMLQFVPVAALIVSVAAAALNRRGYGKLALRIAYWLLIPTVCVLALDGCVGTIGFVD